ncbi:DUF3987 domain-containing protein [Brevundimonas sp.]|uniref:DUF3987 domain-containing protein n=1 Tax=Brevundimonas sp. TaxID=1871086 RepID=UPI00260A1814|nr:DUF3987 domain-containing protein [Brevundimonas sp.]
MQTNPSPSWDAPDTSVLEQMEPPTPDLPSTVFGPFWTAWIDATAQSRGCPADFVALNLLVFAGALIGNARRVRSGTHQQPPILWGAMVAPPSVGKTGAIEPFVEIIRSLDQRIANGEALSFWPQEAGETDRVPQFRLADATPAATAEVASMAPKGLLLLRDELSDWVRRYGSHAMWLEAFNGGSHVENRKNKPPVRIEHLSISVIGGVQPDTLRSLATSQTDRGFASRILYVFPHPVRPQRCRVKASPVAADLLLRLSDLEREATNYLPVAVPLGRRAVEKSDKWADFMFDRMQGHSGIVAGWLGKQRGVSLRIALILEHLWWVGRGDDGYPHEVSTAAITAAQKLIDDYFYPMMLKALGHAELPLEDRWTQALIGLLKRSQALTFNARAAKRGGLGPLGILASPGAFDEACRSLEDACLVRRVGKRAGGSPGRMSADFEVHPLLSGGV